MKQLPPKLDIVMDHCPRCRTEIYADPGPNRRIYRIQCTGCGSICFERSPYPPNWRHL